MATRSDKTLADLTAIAVSPVLIMALVGSLVFFLLEVLYQGDYHGRLQWVLFFFVFGAVLVARISMQAGISDRAPLYGLVLAGLTWVALFIFVEYPPGSDAAKFAWAINLVLIGIIWWSTHRLTWDSTMIDDEVDASGQGLLEVAGLDKAETPTPEKAKEKKKKAKEDGGLIGWLQRYRKFQEDKKKKPHAPGVWVVYFSLAALPLFGLGQSLIPVQEGARRSYAFWLMVIYVGSGLGLLLTTSFLGLRRYLRQRNLQMPAAVTTAWMFLGGILVAALLFVGAVLPRPSAATPLFDLRSNDKTAELKASANAQIGKDQGKGKGRSVGDKGKADEKGEGSRAQQKKGAPKDGSDAKGTAQGEKGDKDGEKGGSKNEKGSDEKGKAASGPGKQKAEGSSSTGRDKKGEQSEGQKKDGSGQGGSDPSSSASQTLSQIIESISKVLKWIVIIVLVALIAFFVIRSGLRWLANFTAWAQRLLNAFHTWWTNLWKFFEKPNRTGGEDEDAQEAARHRPFSSFTDPFLSGASEQMKGEALLRYTFAAFEAWARDRHVGREPGETPFEFVERISNEAPALETDARRMVNLYAGIAYARHDLNDDGLDTLREFWKMLKQVAERPLSASREEVGAPA